LCFEKGDKKMKIIVSSSILCLVLVTLTASLGFADEKSKSDVRTITGCLSKGDGADEFVLAGTDGSTWEVRSSKSGVDFADHVGHTVRATGVVSNATMHNMKEDAKDMAKDSGLKKDNSEHGHLKVTELKMVSDSCGK